MKPLRHAIAPVLFLSATVLAAAPALAQRGDDLITATDLFKIRQLGDVNVSPDGRLIAYTVTSIEPAGGREGTAYRTHIYLASASGEAPTPLTRGAESARQPTWHPSGDTLAFVRAVDGVPQVFILSLFGGEAFQLTRAEHGATDPRFSPDGRRLLYASRLPHRAVEDLADREPAWDAERPGRTAGDADAVPDPDGTLSQVRAWLHAQADSSNPRVFTRLDLQGELDLAPKLTYRHLFAVDVREGAEAVPVTHGFASFDGGDWAGEDRVVAAGLVGDARHPDRIRERLLYAFDVDTLAAPAAPDTLVALDGYALAQPRVAPDGRTVAFLARRLDDGSYAQAELGVYALEGPGPARLLTLGFDRSVQQPRWSADGWLLYFTAPSNGGFPLYRVPPFGHIPDDLYADLVADSLASVSYAFAPADSTSSAAPDGSGALDPGGASPTESPTESLAEADTLAAALGAALGASSESAPPPVQRLTDFGRGVRSFDVTNASVFFVATDPSNPYELYAADTHFDDERRLTAHNAAWLEGKTLSQPEAFTLTRGGVEVPYWVMPPAAAANGKTYPLLVAIHGGPAAMWGPGEATMWHEFQFFAAQGYGIVYANPRGSGGYGLDYKRRNYQDWGAGPAADVLAAADSAAALPWVDTAQQVVAGGSYAGYLTAWIVAHDDRFRAAVAQRGVYDLAAFLGEGNAWRLVPDHFGGYPWDGEAPLPAGDDDGFLGVIPASAAPDTSLLDTLGTTGTAGALGTAAMDSSAAADSSAVDTPAPETFAELLRRNSPLTYVADIRTPLLIMHADDDLRTGVSQSEMLYKSLKILERPVEYVRYPNAGHDLSRTGHPLQRLDRILRIYEFFERYVR